MIRLDKNNRSLGAVLSGAVATNELHVIATFTDKFSRSDSALAYLLGATKITATNGATDITIVSAPDQNVTRDVDYISVRNRDTAAATVSIEYDDNGTDYVLYSATLAVGDTLVYTIATGWYVLDSTGRLKSSAGVAYEAATAWTPVLTFATPGDLNVAYTTQVADATKLGDTVRATFNIVTSTFTHTTASGNVIITGLPYTSANVTGLVHRCAVVWRGVTKANYTDAVASLSPNASQLGIVQSGDAQTPANVTAADMPTTGTVQFSGTIIYRALS